MGVKCTEQQCRKYKIYSMYRFSSVPRLSRDTHTASPRVHCFYSAWNCTQPRSYLEPFTRRKSNFLTEGDSVPVRDGLGGVGWMTKLLTSTHLASCVDARAQPVSKLPFPCDCSLRSSHARISKTASIMLNACYRVINAGVI